MNRALIVVLALMLNACGSPPVRPDGTPASDRDIQECQYEAMRAVPDTGVGSAMQIGFQRGQLVRQCLELRGYVYR